MRKTFILILALFTYWFLLVTDGFAGGSSRSNTWLVDIDDPVYEVAEEAAINRGIVPPLEDTPVSADVLRSALSPDERSDKKIMKHLELPFYPVSPIVEPAFYVGYSSDKDRMHYVKTADRSFLDFKSTYKAFEVPSILKTGFTLQAGGWSVLFQPEVRKAMPFVLNNDNYTNIPGRFVDLDENFPYRGFINYSNGLVEFTLARDRLKLGPGRWGTLSINNEIPYYDYLRGRINLGWFVFSSYLIRLNPIVTPAESEALQSMSAQENPEVNARYEMPFYERSKHVAIHKLFLLPLPWLGLGFSELNMIGGRTPQLADFSPIIIFHNTFEEGCNNVAMSVTAQIVPLPGIKVYGEFYLDEAVVADETNKYYKPGAGGYQFGFTLLSDRYFSLGPGRFRLDGEFSLVDPWCYDRWYDFKKFTSRMVFVETGQEARNWVDYPFGYYLGNDVMDIHLRLSYGRPGVWEAALTWNKSGLGSIDLYGWGSDSLFSHTTEETLPLRGAPTSREGVRPYEPARVVAQWNNSLRLDFGIYLKNGIKTGGWISYTTIENRFNIEGNNTSIFDGGLTVGWKVF